MQELKVDPPACCLRTLFDIGEKQSAGIIQPMAVSELVPGSLTPAESQFYPSPSLDEVVLFVVWSQNRIGSRESMFFPSVSEENTASSTDIADRY
jgi:hypothetical protein